MTTQADSTKWDVIIVGSGPGGATAAKELTRRNKRVLILEQGRTAPRQEGFFSTASLFAGVTVGDNLWAPTAFTTGGATSVYFAVAGLPPVEALQVVGIDISGEIDEVKRELPISILPDEMLGEQALRVRDSATALGHQWQKNAMLVDLSKCPDGYTYQSKWHARIFLQDAVAGGATLLTRARVRKVLIDEGRAVGVEYGLFKGGVRIAVRRAYAERVILAAGAAHSPLILRNSGMKNVGRDGFYCLPGFLVLGTVAGMNARENYAACMGTGLEDGIALGDGNLARNMYRLTMLFNRRFRSAFQHSKSIGVAVLVRDSLGGGLQENSRYHKRLNPEEFAKLGRGEQAARRILENAGARGIFKTKVGAVHMGGTIRLKEHLDENLQTECINLHVCDGSVLPESTNMVSPTLTLVCLGKYLAKRLS
ncbi:MAG: GMC family oxidoreductase N-terminal domain-containing protein [Terracidiphilus sp.]|jgi:choline dehydrogenase-like flavoprotein